MKTLATLILLIVSISCMAQLSHTDSVQYKRIKKIEIKTKKLKSAFIASGLGIIGGSLINIAKSNSKLPLQENYKKPEDYTKAIKNYDSNQRSLNKASSICYIFSGLVLFSIAITF